MSAPAVRVNAHQRHEMALNPGGFASQNALGSSQFPLFEFSSLNSRHGEGCADLP